MNEDELMQKFDEIMKKYPDDTEMSHLYHDVLIIEYFRSIGFNRFADAYEQAPAWYA